MGQNQLLLLVLGVVLVGGAIAIGIQTFESAARQNQADDVLNRNLRIAQEAVNWRARAETFGGGGNGTYDPLAEGGFEIMEIEADLAHTVHAVLRASGTTLELVGVSTASPGVGAYVRLEGDEVAETRVAFDGSIALP